MAKKGTSKSEKKLLKEMLEEEELLLDALDSTTLKKNVTKKKENDKIEKIKPIKSESKKIIKKQIKKRKKRVEMLRHLMDEGKRDYTEADEKDVTKLLTRIPKKKAQESAYSRREKVADVHHKQELQTALEHYPRVHMLRLLKITVFIFIVVVILLFVIAQTGLFPNDITGSFTEALR